jgi:hypothetical protein
VILNDTQLVAYVRKRLCKGCDPSDFPVTMRNTKMCASSHRSPTCWRSSCWRQRRARPELTVALSTTTEASAGGMRTVLTDDTVRIRAHWPGIDAALFEAACESAHAIGVWLPTWRAGVIQRHTAQHVAESIRPLSAGDWYDSAITCVNSPAVVRWVGFEPIGDHVANVGYWVRTGQPRQDWPPPRFSYSRRLPSTIWVSLASSC